MKGYGRAAIGFAILTTAVFSENLFGREFNRLFLLLPGIDKVLHVTEYFGICVVVFWLAGRGTNHRGQRAAIAVGAGLLLALADEFTQRIAADRNFELLDVAANMAGLMLGWVVTARPRRAVAVPVALAALTTAGYVSHSTHALLTDYATALQYERRHDFATAREYYLRALAKGMRTPAIYNELAWVTVEGRAGSAEEAVGYARRAFDAQPENPDVLDTYGWALHHAGRSREALPLLEEAFKRNPEIYCIHYHLGEVYMALARPDLAEPHFRAQMALPGTREAPMAERALERLKAQELASGERR